MLWIKKDYLLYSLKDIYLSIHEIAILTNNKLSVVLYFQIKHNTELKIM